jgi:low temperature requirement protein LtrA
MINRLLEEARRAWAGLWHLARNDAEAGLAHFEDSHPALVRSFIAAAASLAVTRLLIGLILPAAQLEQLGFSSGGLVRDLVVNIVVWLLWLTVAWVLARLYGRAQYFRRYVIVNNWFGAFLTIIFDPLLALATAAASLPLSVIATIASMTLFLFMMVRLARLTLNIGFWQSVAMNAAIMIAMILVVAALEP